MQTAELMNSVEFLIAKEDKTWDTTTVSVPASVGLEREDLTVWAEINLTRQAQYRKVVMFAVYHIPRGGDGA